MNTGTALIKIDLLDPRWISFISSHPRATIFHHPAWIGTLNQCYGYSPFVLAICDSSGEIYTGLPIMEVNHPLNNRRWVSLPFSDYCNALYSSEDSLAGFTASLIPAIANNKITRVELRWAFPEHRAIQMKSSYVLHTLPLNPDSMLVAKKANRQQMQNVRIAEKNGVRVVRGSGIEDVRAFYRLHSLTRRKHGVPVQPWKFFQLLTEFVLEKGLGFVLLAYRENTCISAGLFLHWQRTLTYKYSATDETQLHLRPNHLITWTAIKWGCENSFTTFDFGRAELEDEGLRSYKCRWGADEDPLSYSYIPSAPALATGEGRLGNILKEVIRRSPVWVCKATGQILYRYLG